MFAIVKLNDDFGILTFANFSGNLGKECCVKRLWMVNEESNDVIALKQLSVRFKYIVEVGRAIGPHRERGAIEVWTDLY